MFSNFEMYRLNISISLLKPYGLYLCTFPSVAPFTFTNSISPSFIKENRCDYSLNGAYLMLFSVEHYPLTQHILHHFLKK